MHFLNLSFIYPLCHLLSILISYVTVLPPPQLLNWPNDAIEAGLTNFSAVLVGTVTVALYPVFFHQPLSPAVWGYMVLASVFRWVLGRTLVINSLLDLYLAWIII